MLEINFDANEAYDRFADLVFEGATNFVGLVGDFFYTLEEKIEELNETLR